MKLRALLLLLAAAAAWAQTPTGQVTGQVTDSTGAAVPTADISVTNTETGLSRQTATNETGNYTVPLLPPGQYRVSVRKDGFRPVTETGYTLQVDQVLRVDFHLQLGASSERIEVVASTPVLDTETASRGTVIENRKITDLPLNTRNTFRLALIAPGVTPGPGYGDAFNTASGFRINGGRANQNEMMIDGVSNAMSAANPILVIAIFPSPDALEEFKVQTNSYSAEYGRTAGGVVNMVVKSGSNQLHGSAYEFLRNSVLDANSFFANRAGTPLASFRRNQFGATAGGPIRKDKAFLFFSYEGLRLSSAANSTRTVPTAAQRAGDFSSTTALVAGQCVPVSLYDPTTTRANPSGAGFIRDPFPGNRIPSTRFDPAAAKIVTYYPLPNLRGDNCTGANNFFASGANRSSSNQIDSKFDWNLSQKDRIFLGLSWRNLEQTSPNFYGNPAEPAAGIYGDSYPAGAVRLDYTRVQTPSLIWNVRLGVSRLERHFNQQAEGFDMADLGFSKAFTSTVQGARGFPQISVTAFGAMGNAASNTDQAQTLYSFNVSATWIKGRHTVKAGVDGRFNQAFEYSAFQNTGSFSFTQGFTQGPDPNAPRADRGNGLASLLLGTGSGTAQIVPPILTSSPYYAFYAQDDFKLTRRLTLNFGVRYDIEPGRTERFDQLSWFDFNAPSPLATQSAALSQLRGGLQFVGVNGNDRRQFTTDFNNFAPRFGFAFTLTPKTVLRGGYGIFYMPFVGVATGTSAGINGFLSTTTWTNSIDGLTPLNYLWNAFPNGLNPPTGSKAGLMTAVGETLGASRDGAIDRGSRVGYSQNWSFGVQRSFWKSASVDVSYVGSKGTKLMDNGWQLNQLPASALALGSALQTTVPNPFFGLVNTGLLAERTVTRAQLLKPYPQYIGLYDFRPASSSSTYHSVQLSFQKRFNSGTSVLVSYTGGKLIDDSTGTTIGSGGQAPEHMDIYNRNLDRAVSSQDISRRLVATAVYEIPFGRGKQFGKSMPRILDQLIGNWQLNGIVTYSTAPPISVTAPNNTSSNSSVQRPNQIRDANISGDRSTDDKIAKWFDTAAFVQPAAFTYGNAPRTLSNVRSDSLRSIDFSLFKQFPFGERRFVQFRAEAFNLTNTVQFGVPGTTLGAAAFGVVSGQANLPRQVQFGLRIAF